MVVFGPHNRLYYYTSNIVRFSFYYQVLFFILFFFFPFASKWTIAVRGPYDTSDNERVVLLQRVRGSETTMMYFKQWYRPGTMFVQERNVNIQKSIVVRSADRTQTMSYRHIKRTRKTNLTCFTFFDCTNVWVKNNFG